MSSKKVKATLGKSLPKRIQEVIWEKHLQELPEGPYSHIPIVVSARPEASYEYSVRYQNDI